MFGSHAMLKPDESDSQPPLTEEELTSLFLALAAPAKLCCPYCGSPACLTNRGLAFGSGSCGLVWICTKFPDCDAYVGCHPGTTKPLGSLANPLLRQLRIVAHAAFNSWYKRFGLPRREAYNDLAARMGLLEHEAHIAKFGED